MRSALIPILLNSVPGWVRNAYGILVPVAAVHFNEGRAWVRGVGTVDPASLLNATRAIAATTLLPSSTAGAGYMTFGTNVPAIGPGVGLQVFDTAINKLLNSAAPATQTTPSLGTGTYTLWVNGTGTATSSAGSATGSGFGVASNGAPNTFTLTGAGTVTVTVSGSLNAFQLQSGPFGTSFIVTAGAPVTQAADNISLTTAFSTLIPTTTGTLFFDMGAVGWGNDGADHSLLAFLQSGSTPGVGKFSGGTIALNDGVGYRTSQAYTNSAVFKYAVAYGGAAINSSLNGGTVSNYASYAGSIAGTAKPFKIGSGAGSAYWNGTFKRVAIFDKVLDPVAVSVL